MGRQEVTPLQEGGDRRLDHDHLGPRQKTDRALQHFQVQAVNVNLEEHVHAQRQLEGVESRSLDGLATHHTAHSGHGRRVGQVGAGRLSRSVHRVGHQEARGVVAEAGQVVQLVGDPTVGQFDAGVQARQRLEEQVASVRESADQFWRAVLYAHVHDGVDGQACIGQPLQARALRGLELHGDLQASAPANIPRGWSLRGSLPSSHVAQTPRASPGVDLAFLSALPGRRCATAR